MKTEYDDNELPFQGEQQQETAGLSLGNKCQKGSSDREWRQGVV